MNKKQDLSSGKLKHCQRDFGPNLSITCSNSTSLVTDHHSPTTAASWRLACQTRRIESGSTLRWQGSDGGFKSIDSFITAETMKCPDANSATILTPSKYRWRKIPMVRAKSLNKTDVGVVYLPALCQLI
jgi:hypothetical protein